MKNENSFKNLPRPIFWLSERTKVSAKKSRPSLLDEIEKKVQGRSLTKYQLTLEEGSWVSSLYTMAQDSDSSPPPPPPPPPPPGDQTCHFYMM